MGISCSRRHKIPIVSITAKFNIHTESGGELSSEDKESALRVIGNIINNSIRWDSDLAGRVDEDKIGIILMQCKKEDAIVVINRIVNSFKKNDTLVKKDGSGLHISLSMGYIAADLSHDSISLLKEAEENVVINEAI